ncbi:hypothetical protein [Paraburkholderia ferrariae]|uniref:Uncharacterized protein n=1 Tax=Paraburkholderia ferrariae TaxID=386056 RepID=A0ABU9RIG3_9BURK
MKRLTVYDGVLNGAELPDAAAEALVEALLSSDAERERREDVWAVSVEHAKDGRLLLVVGEHGYQGGGKGTPLRPYIAPHGEHRVFTGISMYECHVLQGDLADCILRRPLWWEPGDDKQAE